MSILKSFYTHNTPGVNLRKALIFLRIQYMLVVPFFPRGLIQYSNLLFSLNHFSHLFPLFSFK